MKAIQILAFAAFAAFVIVLAGCSTRTKDTPAAATNTPTATASTLPVYKNAKGEIECPVTGSVVTSVDSAAGYQDWNGTRYYFCCADCPAKFKADPEKFAVRHEKVPM